MELIPAIDLLGGQVVRLYQGDYERATVYSTDPVAVARGFHEAGAGRIHIVDLDGARTGNPTNHATIREIAASAGVPVQVGGGIRTMETAAQLLDAGVERVVFGTAAVREPRVVREACLRFGAAAVVVSVDAKAGRVVVQGWIEESRVAASDLIRRMAEYGVGRFVYTDVARDGTMTEPNFDAVRSLVRETGASIIASGGIASLDHLLRLAKAGAEAAIVGRALYDGAINLAKAVKALRLEAG